jgi:hypothetical protein
MLQSRTSLLAAPLCAAGFLLGLAPVAHAQQQPPPQYAPAPPQYQQAPPQYQQAPPQYAPAPPQYQQAPPQYGQPPPTVIIQQQYPPPVYPQQPIYVQQAPQQPQGPRIIKDWDPDQPIPLGYHKEERARKGLIIGGAVMFGAMYLITALSASVANDASGPGYSASWLYVPAIGPLFQMGQNGSNGGATGTVDFLCILDSLVQIGGITMFAVGLAHPNTELVRNDFGFSLHLQPMLGPNQQGMGLGGTF